MFIYSFRKLLFTLALQSESSGQNRVGLWLWTATIPKGTPWSSKTVIGATLSFWEKKDPIG